MAADERIHLSRGRLLSYLDEGERDAAPILFFHGIPGSRLGALDLVDDVTERGGRIIAPDRPGTGRSEPDVGRSLASWAGDIADLTNILGLARFRLLAYSGGAPFALATAWALPDRVERVALLSSVGSFDVPGAMDGMSRASRSLWLAARWQPRVLGWMLARQARAWRDHDRFGPQLSRSLSEPDRAAFDEIEPDRLERFRLELVEAMSQGSSGPVEDMRLVRAPWGFGVQDVRVPVQLWHGEDDHSTPLAMGGWLAAMLPDCTPRFLKGEGHFSTILHHSHEALDWLLLD